MCATCTGSPQFGGYSIGHLLWYVDTIRYAESGQTITGASYVRRQFGPAPRDLPDALDRLRASGSILIRSSPLAPFQPDTLISLVQPDISVFTAQDISLVDTITSTAAPTRPGLTLLGSIHDEIWPLAAIGEEIPFAAAAFGSRVGEIDEADMAWAIDQVRSLSNASVNAA